MKHVVIVGGGFAGLHAAKKLGNKKGVRVTLLDRTNHHLFQPLLYQVAMAALSPADIAGPIRHILAGYRNITVLQDEVFEVHLAAQHIITPRSRLDYDYLILCCGSQHAYFGHEEWEEFAPGLKTIEQATEIRRRVLTAYEAAEREEDPQKQRSHLTFAIVGGGPTGVELAGAIGEMSRFTLDRDFRNIDPKLTRIILIEAGPRILPSFPAKLAGKATRDLEKLGVQVWANSPVTKIDGTGVQIDKERIECATVLWAAGVRPSALNAALGVALDRQGRVIVEPDLSVAGHPEVFVAGDQAHFDHGLAHPLPGIAPVALQQGHWIAQNILRSIRGAAPRPFQYLDKGQLATIGRSRAILQLGNLQLSGFLAWVAWLIIHIYYLIGFKNRLFVTLNWAWSFFSFRRGARLIINKEWRFYKSPQRDP
ncbi:MAG: NAD(P)/FAD-dependent oxidoreductase [Proteobacteria bacterium]|nr:NAD(P)/FAD-dependent oxidoreductase [Pseudomonadota bacterium]MBU1639033.1 NAD(P)/FAD-dependent oxidoreductase [Pseudomonadota bacterium]